MIPHDSLQPLHDLDRTSPLFHGQLIDFLRGNEYRDVIPSLQNEDLAWLIEYLDGVSLLTISSNTTLNVGVGPLRHLRSPQCPISGTATRTQKDMWRQGSATKIVHTFGVSPGLCV